MSHPSYINNGETEFICQSLLATESNKEHFTLINTVQMKDLLLCLTSDRHIHTHTLTNG